MTKRAPKKKVTRRLKRSVRKALAAVLMITAIGVAAIPVPETAAADPSSGGTTGVSVRQEPVTYVPGRDLTIEGIEDLDDFAESDGTGYRLIQVGGSWQLHWLFRYYQKTVNGNVNTIISKYNDNYPQQSIDIGQSVYSEYQEVETATYDTWLERLKISTQEWTLSNPNEGTDLATIKRYFKESYKNYKEQWDAWNSLPDDRRDPAQEPHATFKEADIAGNPDNAMQYYCEKDIDIRDPAFRLVACQKPVRDTVSGNDTVLKKVYIPRLVTKIAEETGNTVDEELIPLPQNRYDANGFLPKTELTAVTAIAPRAFKGVVNLRELSLPEQTKYIGDEAFEGATSITNLSGIGIEALGNRAFKGCTSIKQMDIMSSLKTIGTEAFAASGISDITFASSLQEIGPGAFNGCSNLSTIVVENATRSYFKIGPYAFFDCPRIQNFDWNTANDAVTEIGEGAFAFSSTTEGEMDKFTFPLGVPTTARIKLGDKIFANRTGLREITMPKVEIEHITDPNDHSIPQYTFLNCYNLDWVEFPADSNSMATADISFPADAFNEVINEQFYIKGSKYKKGDNRNPALSRTSTWYAKSVGLPKAIPYLFVDTDGSSYYEICQDEKLLLVDDSGALYSCTFEPTQSGTCSHSPSDISIPAYAGDRLITSIESGSFDQEDLYGHKMKDYITEITFDENSAIQSIGDGVFKDCPKLKKVVLSGSVSSVGNEAFANCGTDDPSVTFDVTFDTPNGNNASGNVTLGNNAFTTGGSPIIFRGIAQGGYGPYEHAINPQTYANQEKNLRICYKSISPQNMTIIIDNATNEPVLVDYPFYEDVDESNRALCEKMEKYFTAYYKDAKYDNYRTTAPDDGPWKEDGDGNGISDYYDANPYSIKAIYENIKNGSPDPYSNEPFMQMTLEGSEILDAIFNVVVPEGVTSIDVQAYYDNANRTYNGYNIAEYLQDNKYRKYLESGSSAEDVVPGLFSGYFDESTEQQQKKGNDYVESIELLSVTRLPDYAFDSCEKLKSVSIGSACEDIGTAPFRGCSSMVNFIGNDKFTAENGIIYSNNDAGYKTIETCMPTRGTLVDGVTVGSTSLNTTTDPLLAQVSHIKEGAFESCEGIRKVDFTGVDKLTEIPTACFKDCSKITEAKFPSNINAIEEEAFANNEQINAIIYGKEVSIRNNAFTHGEGKVRIKSYTNSAAHRYAKTYNIDFEPLEDLWEVIFMDYDGTYLADTQYVEDGNPAKVPDNPIRVGYTFTGWSPTVNKMSTQEITADVTFVAQYKPDGSNSGGNTDPSTPTNPDNSNTDNTTDTSKKKIYTVTVINGSGSGSYEEGAKVSITANAPSTGRKFDRWETSSLNVAIDNVKNQSASFTMPANNVVVTAVYDGKSANTSSGSTTGSSSGVSGNGSSGSGSSSSSSSGSAGGSNVGGSTGSTAANAGQNGTIVSIPNGIGVSNTGTASATVDGSTDNFVVRINSDPYATAAVEAALTKEFGSLDHIRYYPMDISLYDSTGTTPITDTTGLSVNITMPIPDDLIPYAGNNKAGAVVNGDTLEKLNATFKTIDGVPCINFTATHFSPYTIYVDTQNLTAAMDASPKTGDPIHPKWFLAIGLACLSVVLFMKKDKKSVKVA
ncbi:MAG: leucine-rich repeat protein [Lachnospiraceae bacterium]|nr:leucine-rich repeat protein [Lachnospiraceae bacterium]